MTKNQLKAKIRRKENRIERLSHPLAFVAYPNRDKLLHEEVKGLEKLRRLL